MSTQHTPGPWYWIGDNALWSEKDGEVIESGDDGKPYGMHSGEIHHHYDDATKDANKALIAAAPDLLEALIEVRAYLSKCPPHAEDITGAKWGRVMDLSGAALNKAEGKS